jgi:N-acetylglutamate synthase-like GNAT family acetyltransferase
LPEFQIRPARSSDAPALARLRYEFRAGDDSPVQAEADFLTRCTAWMEPRLAPGGTWRCWLAEEAGRPVGTIWLKLIEKLPNPVGERERHGYVSSLYVVPSSRGAGLGSRLLEVCLEACEAEHLDAVFLWPTPRSRSLYERHGFAVADDLLERRPSSRRSEQATGGVHGPQMS